MMRCDDNSKLLNTVKSDALDERVINFPEKKGTLNAWEVQENHNLFLTSARACGCPLLNIGSMDLQKGTVSIAKSIPRLFDPRGNTIGRSPCLVNTDNPPFSSAYAHKHTHKPKHERRNTLFCRRSGRW